MHKHFNNQNKDKKKVIIKKSCKYGILFENDLYAIAYDKNQNINNELIIFDVLREKEIRTIDLKEISDIYSNLFMINYSILCLSIKNKDNILALLFININTQKKIEYITNGFKAICFCSLNSNQEISNNSIDTLIFLIGGNEDDSGKILLLKVEYDNNENEIINIEKEIFIKWNKPIDFINYIKEKKEILFIDQEGNINKKRYSKL